MNLALPGPTLIVAAAALAAALAGCSSTPVSPTAAAAPAGTAAQPLAAGAAPARAGIAPGSGVAAGGQSTVATVQAAPAATAPADAAAPTKSVFFAFDDAGIGADYTPVIEQHGRWLGAHAGATVRVEGNTDERGSSEYNLALGQKRADALKKMLTLLGAREEQVEAVSLGEEKPRAQGSSDEAFAENRRDDILYGGEY